jgi:predicted transcriptional regulator of viral defense system
MASAGLSSANREFVSRLNRGLRGPFTIEDATAVAGVDRKRVARLLRHLAAQGWLARVQRGLYTTVPLEAEDSSGWSADPWAVGAAALAPGYVGGWTALSHWDLTDQVFATTVFITSRPVPRRQRQIGRARFELRHRPESAIFGTRRVWRDGTAVTVSDVERTLVDCLDDPSMGGGIRHTAEALEAYAAQDGVDWFQMIGYGDRLGNGAVFKRLGYLLEALRLADDRAIGACRNRITAGVSKLDPSRPASGSTVARWRLRVNAGLD